MPPKSSPSTPLNNALLALTASALAIPGLSAQAQGLAGDAMPPAQHDNTLLDSAPPTTTRGISPAARLPTARAASATMWSRSSSAPPPGSARKPT